MPNNSTTTARGYGYAHKQTRKRWTPLVLAGTVTCAKCGHPITPTQRWDLGHNDQRTAWTGPEHRACNRADGARRGNALRRRPATARRW